MFYALLLLGNGAPAILGFTLILLNVIWSILAYLHLPRDSLHVKILQRVYIGVVLLICIIFGVNEITGIDWTDRCTMKTNPTAAAR